MNALTWPFGSPQDLNLQKTSLVGILERFCQIIEPTQAQRETAKSRYESIGRWVVGSGSPMFSRTELYVQGSFAIRTATRPLTGQEYDVDLVCYMAALGISHDPGAVKRALGVRLAENQTYAKILEEKPRCWRLNFANEIHADVTPSVPNSACPNGGELVPDKSAKCWKCSNPKGYRTLFERRAALMPHIRTMMKSIAADAQSRRVTPFPEQGGFKGPLQRTVQLAKRHRDLYFLDADPCLSPISVIITTLAARSYEYCVTNFEYDNELDLLVDIAERMPNYVTRNVVNGAVHWFIENETTAGENFAEKWNAHPERAIAFFDWHKRLCADVNRLAAAAGMDVLRKSMSDSFGATQVNEAFDLVTHEVSAARSNGRLSVGPLVGLTTRPALGTQVRANTFFGRG